MAWVAAGLVLLFLMLRFPAFGGVVLAGVAALGLYLYNENAEADRRAAQARSPEHRKMISLGDTKLYVGEYSSRLEGVVSNVSAGVVSSFIVRVRVFDCPSAVYATAPKEGCPIIGDDESNVYLEIPAGQKRAFQADLVFRGLPNLKPGEWTWGQGVTEVNVR